MTSPAPPKQLAPFPWKALVIAVIACVVLGLLYKQIDISAAHAWANRLNGVLVFVLIVVLPLFGVPVTLLYLVAGARFGTALGLPLVVVSVVLQILASYALVGAFRDTFARWLASVRERIPRGAYAPVTLFTALVPGVPYFAKNYVLPLIGVPLRICFIWCFPVHVVHSIIAVVFGEHSNDLTPARLTWLGLYAVAVIIVSWWTFRRLHGHLSNGSGGTSA